MENKEIDISIGILDFNRPKEAALLLATLKQNAQFIHKTVYISNGGEQDYVKKFYDEGLIYTLILNKFNWGCGIGTRQVFESCMTKFVIYCQVDQFLQHVISEDLMQSFLAILGHENEFRKKMGPMLPNLFYIDLAGNQGRGQFSERALLIERKRYLSIPDLDKTVGGPGLFANQRWTENLVQQYMKDNNLYFYSLNYFGDNGKVSIRDYPCGGQTMHFTDEKTLFCLKPLKQRYCDFPNLILSDAEWQEMLGGLWPKEGKIPEADKAHSFVYWK